MAAIAARSLDPFYLRVLSSFPEVSFAFAYGSGVFKQLEGNTKENVIDFLFAVEDSMKWHSQNLGLNWRHYSAVRYGGPSLINNIQRKYGAGIYYNTLIPFENRIIKYGVIRVDNLIADLLDWETLYVSGRLHKPVLMLQRSDNATLQQALNINLQSAVHTALLLLPEMFTAEELFLALAGLSYMGDFRMHVGEDKNKVKNIVRAQLKEFHELYDTTLKASQHLHYAAGRGKIEQDCSANARLHHLNMIPKALQLTLYRTWIHGGHNLDVEDVLKAIAHDIDCDELVKRGVQHIVKVSSWTQTLKGIITAGPVKTVIYGIAKLKKMFKSS